jgi:tetratricopeptide (TPR) repeat protein
MAQKKRTKKDILNFACGLGIAFSFILCGGFAFVHFSKAASPAADESSFFQALREFDGFLAVSREAGAFDARRVNQEFDKLEKKALSVESNLSVLKRRRLLSQKDGDFLSAYQKAAQRIAARFPASQPLAAVAAESLLTSSAAVNTAASGAEGAAGETADQLRSYAARLVDPAYRGAALDIYVLLGDMNDPVKASAIPGKDDLFPANENRFAIDHAILSLLNGDITAATARVNEALKNKNVPASNGPSVQQSSRPSIQQFAAEFFYDYGKPVRAAEIFAEFPDETSALRQADALWLSGNAQNARNVWISLVNSTRPEIKAKSLYNRAATETQPDKAKDYLAKLFVALQADGKTNADYSVFGKIRYSRLLNTQDAINNLQTQVQNPLIALELLRRQREIWTPDKAIAQTWFLLGKNPTDERIYQWAGWLFDFQRRYAETDMLVQNAEFNGLSGAWLELHEGISLIQRDRLDDALAHLKAVVAALPPAAANTAAGNLWPAPANIGRILEACHSASEALEYYQIAANLEKGAENAARLQFRISRCLHSLGRDAESKAALEAALTLKPDYLPALAELKRLEPSN